MSLERINNNIKSGFTYVEFERSMFRYIQNNLVPILTQMQNEQLFKLSVGSDGVALGYYKNDIKRPVFKAKGTPFSMVSSGVFKGSIKVVVTRTEIVFRAAPKYENRVRFDEVFGTDNWMGLTPANQKILIDSYLMRIARNKTLNKILNGRW